MSVQGQPSSLSVRSQFLSRNLSGRTHRYLEQADEKIQEAAQSLKNGQHILAVKSTLDQAREALGKIKTHPDRLQGLWKQLKACFTPQLAEAEPSTPASNRLSTQLEAKAHFDRQVMPALLSQWKQLNASYNPDNNGKWPLRDVNDQPVQCKLAKAQRVSRFLIDLEALKPFLNPELSPEERATLYSRTMACREITAEDVQQRPDETALIGQKGVFAVRDIKKGTVLGLYGGKLVKPFGNEKLIDDTYLYDCPPLGYIDGDNILSRINTTLEYNSQRKPSGFAENQPLNYNVESHPVFCTNKDGQVFKLPVVVAKTDIPQGTELRLNYHYPDEALPKLFQDVQKH